MLRDVVEVRLRPELGTIVWPIGASLDPDVFYARIAGEPIDLRMTAGCKT